MPENLKTPQDTAEHQRTPQDASVKTARNYAANILKHPEEAIHM